jgi:hypothetical protein
MSNHATLNYSGRIAIETNEDGTIPQVERDKLHALLDDAISAYEGDQVVLRTAVVHFERNNQTVDNTDMPRVHIEVEKDGSISELGSAESTLAQAVVDIGMEADLETATDAISIQ